MPSEPLTLADFAGRWRLTRGIEDLAGGRTGTFIGEAVFTGDAAALDYAESGLLSYGDAEPLHAERRYLWRASQGAIEVWFDDGRFFHRFATDTPEPEARHHCAPDLYRVHYDFRAWPDWRATWEVQGPRKRYRMRSTYTRAP